MSAAPILILALVAVHQLVLVRSEALSPWSGGGFGMFSTADHGSRRHLHAFQVRPGLRREIPLPPGVATEIAGALTLPTEDRLRRIAIAVSDVKTPDHGPPSAVQIQVWATRFDPETLTPSTRILRELVVRFDDRD